MANRLADEQSPYLQQHAHNPVDWYPWGDEPFERAKRENKPVLVSIGYAACHWCHVMERESFENEATAAYMNQHFINIKVDREEYPGVDHMYMDAVQAIAGSGGWPLNVFVTPGRVPFYGGTYFPPQPMYSRLSWVQVLERINDIWTNKPEEIEMQSNQMLQYLQQASQLTSSMQGADWNMDTCRQMAATLLKQADTIHGGFGSAPKFPGTMNISFLLEHYHFTKDRAALDHALFSLEAMIKGGIYDQVGGGFARYATDDNWLVPHFEKMLYDNALLVLSMCDAYSIEKRPVFRRAIEETIAFAERELKEPTGGYYSAIDADSEGVEGKFYTWTWDEWNEIIDSRDKAIAAYFGVSENGNWEHTNILHQARDIEALAEEFGIAANELEQQINNVKRALFIARQKRVRPITDDKSLLSWNALMNLALSRAGAVLQMPEYIQRAGEHMHWILGNFTSNKELMHSWKDGKARIAANLDDYAYLVQSLLQLASVAGDNRWILKANELAEEAIKKFLHEDRNFFYYTSSEQQDIPVRKVELYDGAIPSSNAVMAHNLLLLGLCMERNDYTEQATYMLRQMVSSALRYPSSFGYWAIQLQRYAAGLKLVVSTGRNAEVFSRELSRCFMPHAFVITARNEDKNITAVTSKEGKGESDVFVCTMYECLPPSDDMRTILDLIDNIK